LWHLWCNRCLYTVAMCLLQRILPANRVKLASERTGLTQAGTAPQFGPGGDAGIVLFLG